MILAFPTPDAFKDWLQDHLDQKEGLWLRIYKKGSATPTITYAEALDEALCVGWIDGQKKPYDEESWLQRFCPRKAKGNWSKINIDHAERLIQQNRMQPEGLKEIEAAKADGRWAAAYDSPKNAEPPEDFLKELERNPEALAFYKSLNRANVYAIVYRLQTAKKPETREKRLSQILEMMARKEKFH
jgi:uncharacterized protein YdeI (YjbR/CyaY-like superfamily)